MGEARFDPPYQGGIGGDPWIEGARLDQRVRELTHNNILLEEQVKELKAENERMSVLSPDEVKTVKDLIFDWGFEYSLRADRDKVKALAERLGIKWPD